MKWRAEGLEIRWQSGEQPSESDPVIGSMRSRELAEHAVQAVNTLVGSERAKSRFGGQSSTGT